MNLSSAAGTIKLLAAQICANGGECDFVGHQHQPQHLEYGGVGSDGVDLELKLKLKLKPLPDLDSEEHHHHQQQQDLAELELDDFWPMNVRITMTILFASLSLIGIVGNVMVIIVVHKVKGMITPTNCYLVSLAASDCLFFIATTPTELSYLHTKETEYIFGYFGCAFFTFLPYLAINSSSLSIVAFTIERYIGICHPIRARYICTVKRAKTIIAIIWTFCIVYNSPWLYLATLRIDNGGSYSCSFKLERDHFTYKVMFLGDLVAFYIIPMILYIIIYGKIAFALQRSQLKARPARNMSTASYAPEATYQFCSAANRHHSTAPSRADNYNNYNSSSSPSNNNRKSSNGHRLCTATNSLATRSSIKSRTQVVKMLALVVIIFAFCWLPYRAMVTYNSFAQQKWDPDWYIFWSKSLIFFNCAINPILYNVMSERFRNAFQTLLRGNKQFIYQFQRQSEADCMVRHRSTVLVDSRSLLKHPVGQDGDEDATPSPTVAAAAVAAATDNDNNTDSDGDGDGDEEEEEVNLDRRRRRRRQQRQRRATTSL